MVHIDFMNFKLVLAIDHDGGWTTTSFVIIDNAHAQLLLKYSWGEIQLCTVEQIFPVYLSLHPVSVFVQRYGK